MDNQSTEPARPDEVQPPSVGKTMTATEQAAWRAARRRSRKRILLLVGVGALVCGALYSWWSAETKPRKAGWDAYEAKKYDVAIENFTRALRDDPKDASAYAGRALAYCKKGAPERSLIDSNKAIKLAPDAGVTYTAKAYALTALGWPSKALEALNEGIRRDPRYAPAYFARAELAWRHGLKEVDPIADLQESIRLDPKYAPAYALLGLLYDGREEYDKALAACNKALELDPRDALAYLGRGMALSEMHEEKMGNEDIQKAFRLDPRLQAAFEKMAKKGRPR